MNFKEFKKNRPNATVFTDENFSRFDFEREDLEGLEFVRCSFDFANLSEASFSGCKFTDCNFRGTLMMFPTFLQCEFTYCHFLHVNMTNAEFGTSKFIRSYIQGHFCDSLISHCVFEESIIKHSTFILSGLNGCIFKDSEIKDTLLCTSNISYCEGDLSIVGSSLNYTQFLHCKFDKDPIQDYSEIGFDSSR